jgi:hypothetical protein
MYASILGTVIWGLLIFYQPLLASFGFSVQQAGILYLFFRLFGAAGASASETIYKILGISTVYLIPLCLIVSVLGMGYFITPWVVVLIFVIFFVEGLHYPIVNNMLNKNIPSSHRVTIISLGSVLACLIEVISYPVLGKIADEYTLQMPLRILGFGFLICIGVVLLLLSRTTNGRGIVPGSSKGHVAGSRSINA